MFKLKSMFQKVFGRKAIKPRNVATVLSTPAPEPLVTLDEARQNLLAVLRAVEEKKRVAEKEREMAWQDFFAFICNDSARYDHAECEKVCSPLGINPEAIKRLVERDKMPEFAAAVEYFVKDISDFDNQLASAYETILTGKYTFFEGIYYDDELAEEIARGKVDEDIWGYVDVERLAKDYRDDIEGKYVSKGFFAPYKF